MELASSKPAVSLTSRWADRGAPRTTRVSETPQYSTAPSRPAGVATRKQRGEGPPKRRCRSRELGQPKDMTDLRFQGVTGERAQQDTIDTHFNKGQLKIGRHVDRNNADCPLSFDCRNGTNNFADRDLGSAPAWFRQQMVRRDDNEVEAFARTTVEQLIHAVCAVASNGGLVVTGIQNRRLDLVAGLAVAICQK
jgi:hypothetical protein